MNTHIEQLSRTLGTLYGSYGYRMYTMSKFEEYGLYLRNKDFLISDRILTFTDTDGKLMALKPDVTLSIIKNTRPIPNGVEKMFYRETVYRPGNAGFREITQVGLECMGAVDDYCILEVLLLAVKSLRAIDRSFVLDISHMGLLSLLLDRYGLEGETRSKVTEAIGSKNIHAIRTLCGSGGEDLCDLVRLSGKPAQVLPGLKNIFGTAPQLVQLQKLVAALESAGCEGINIDFSVVNDMRYYNGIVFRGFVEGVPTGVLSGGQYDAMMANMGRPDKAIGFAIYPELLERLEAAPTQNATDAVLLYPVGADLTALCKAAEELNGRGMTVKVLPEGSPLPACKAFYKLEGNEVKEYA